MYPGIDRLFSPQEITVFRIPEVRSNTRRWFHWSNLTVSPSELMDVTFCVLLYLTSDYVLRAFFIVPEFPWLRQTLIGFVRINANCMLPIESRKIASAPSPVPVSPSTLGEWRVKKVYLSREGEARSQRAVSFSRLVRFRGYLQPSALAGS